MKRLFATFLIAGLATAAVVAAPGTAEAGSRSHHHGRNVGIHLSFGGGHKAHYRYGRYYRGHARPYRHYRAYAPIIVRPYYAYPPASQVVVVREPAPAPDRMPASAGAGCREYQTTVVIGGQEQRAYGTACPTPDGDWKRVD